VSALPIVGAKCRRHAYRPSAELSVISADPLVGWAHKGRRVLSEGSWRYEGSHGLRQGMAVDEHAIQRVESGCRSNTHRPSAD